MLRWAEVSISSTSSPVLCTLSCEDARQHMVLNVEGEAGVLVLISLQIMSDTSGVSLGKVEKRGSGGRKVGLVARKINKT